MVTEAMAHSPKRRRGQKRPGGRDTGQAVYLSVAEAFVSGDVRLLEAATEVSSTLRYPRRVISVHDFLDGLAAPFDPESRCMVCGSSTHTSDRTRSIQGRLPRPLTQKVCAWTQSEISVSLLGSIGA